MRPRDFNQLAKIERREQDCVGACGVIYMYLVGILERP